MANACFRCQERIDSGKTFCGSCRQQVSLDFSYTRESRAWTLVAGSLALQVLFGVVVLVRATVPGMADNPVVGTAMLLVSALVMPSIFLMPYGLLKDAGHLRRRDDTDWNPSKWGYWALAFLALFVLPGVPIAVYHLYRRWRTVGLRLRQYAE